MTLAWHGLRESTRNVDSLRPLGADLAQAAEQLWQAHPHAPDDPHLANFIAGIAGATAPGGGPERQYQRGTPR